MSVAAAAGAALAMGDTILNSYESNQQRSWIRHMWDLNNRYNSPASQRKRLREAGINPGLAMQNGMLDSGTADQPSAPSLPSYDFSPAASLIGTGAELSLQRRQVEADVGLKEENTIAQAQRNKFGLYDAYFDVLNKIADLKKKNADTSFLEIQKNYMEKEIFAYDRRSNAEVGKMEKEALVAERQAAVLDLQASYQKIVNEFLPQEKRNALRIQEATIAEIYSAAARNKADAAYSAAQKAVSQATKEGLDIDNNQKRQIVDALVDEAYNKAEESYWNSQSAAKRYHEGRVGDYLPGSDSKGDTRYYDRSHRRSRYSNRSSVSSSKSGVR